MTRRTNLPFLGYILLAALGPAACGLDEHYTGMGDKALPGDPLYPKEKVTCTGGGGGTLSAADLTGMAWRFDSFKLSKPTELLNDLFLKPQIEAQTLNILLIADADDRTAGTLQMRIVAADPSGETYTPRGDGSSLPCTLAGAAFTSSADSSLQLPVDVLAPPLLPVRNLKLGGTFSSNAGDISSGTLTGALLGADATATKMGEQSLGEMLTSMAGTPPDLDLEPAGAPDGVKDSWTVTGTFTAAKVSVAK